MSRFTKYTLLVAVLVLAAAATASAVVYSYYWRGYFTFGGEWLIPAVVALVWQIGKEIKRLFRFTEENDNEKIH